MGIIGGAAAENPSRVTADSEGASSSQPPPKDTAKDLGTRRQLITFDNNDPEFDVDSDPDGDLDL
jgi:hypothetical protein